MGIEACIIVPDEYTPPCLLPGFLSSKNSRSVIPFSDG
jgi:hypothetical protein